MHPFLTLLLKFGIVSCILYLYYYVALRRTKYYQYNRFYILSAVAFSLVVPFLHFSLFPVGASHSSRVINLIQVIASGSGEEEITSAKSERAVSQEDILLIGYAIVSLVLLTLTSVKIIRLYKIRRQSPAVRKDGYNFITTQLSMAPFSFMNNLFWKEAIDIDCPAGRQMLAHEMVHIKQKHTIDKLFMQAVLIVAWINPFYWLFQKDLAMLHEYAADDAAIEGHDTDAFAKMLLLSHFQNAFPDIIHPFYYSSIKKRIIMLSTTNNTRFGNLRKLVVLPLALTTAALFSFKVSRKDPAITNTGAKMVVMIDPGHGGLDKGCTNKSGLAEKDLALRLSKKIGELAPAYNIAAVQTRNADNYITLNDRVEKTNGSGADVFVSIHVNKHPDRSSAGSDYEVCVSSKSNPRLNESTLLASSVISRLQSMGLKPVVTSKSLPVLLRDNKVPAILIECGDIDNSDEMAMLQDDARLERFCKNILAGIAEYGNSKTNK